MTKMPESEVGVWFWLRKWISDQNEYRVAIEKVGGYIGSSGNKGGGIGNTGSTMFAFGRSYGGLLMGLTALDLKFINPVPRTWQKAVGIESKEKDESKDQFKRRLKARAVELYPESNPTLNTADAILLAHYASLE